MTEKIVVRVRDVMKTEFDMVEGMTTVADALRNAKHIDTTKCFIVNRRHDGDEYGILLLSDIAKTILAKDRAAQRVNVYEIMAKPVVSIDPNMDIRYCARLFETFGLGRAPVIEDRTVLGIIGYTDIVLRGLRDRL